MNCNQTNHPEKKTTRKIAIFSDVHANLPALDAVIGDAEKNGADEFWDLGDITGYGPFVNETVELLFKTCSRQIIGNYDLKVLKFSQRRDKWKHTKNPEAYLAFEWAWENLSDENVKRLKTLPKTLDREVEGVSFLLTHGGPEKVDELINKDTPAERLETLAGMTDAKVILCGHTHSQFLREVGGKTFVNPGSVGRPNSNGARACYVMAEISGGKFRMVFHEINYDVGRLTGELKARKLPDSFSEMFNTGRHLRDLKPRPCEWIRTQPRDMNRTVAKVRALARKCYYEREHSEQVVKLSKMLFDRLGDVHGMDEYEKFLLTCAAILHDIGWLGGQSKHHKASMNMILDDRTVPLNPAERKIVAMIARYHRKALPKSSHRIYRDMPPRQRKTVGMLAGILRMADGLDRSHMSAVKKIDVVAKDGCIEFKCGINDADLPEMLVAAKKSDLFAKATGLKVRFSANRGK